MVYTDWNHYGSADTNHTLDDSPAKEGSSSLHVNAVGKNSYDILAQSETDAPTEARVQSEGYASSYGTLHSAIFRWQDASNYYIAATFYHQANAETRWAVAKVVAGTPTLIEYQYISANTLNGYTLEDGSGAAGRWVPYRIDAWVDSAGDIRFRFEEDSTRDGSWTQVGTDIVDSSPSLTSGGGVGVGVAEEALDFYGGNPHHYDKTEVYY